jgi:hypothetical protein
MIIDMMRKDLKTKSPKGKIERNLVGANLKKSAG